MPINPTVRIIVLLAFAGMLQGMQLLPLAVCTGGLLVGVVVSRASDFMLLLKRARWLLLSIAVIYAYATPGEFIPGIPDGLAPSYEGLRDGGVQALRLTSMLAALSVLLASSTRAQIMAGIYQLSQPLRLLGFQPERFAARLWLTLHYVEHMPPHTLRTLHENHWNIGVLQKQSTAPERIGLEFSRWHWLDVLVVLSLPLLWWCVR